MDFILNILAFLVVLTPVVFIHELGHYWAARRSGVVVEVFAVGFGRELIGFTDKNKTRWRLCAVPLGGYVKMRGDADGASAPIAGGASLSGSFQAASLKAKAFIVAAGPIANFILGVVLIAGIYIGVGKVTIPPVVGQVQEGSAASIAGIKQGDRILSINGYDVDDFGDIRGHVFENPGKPIAILVDRDGQSLSVDAVPNTIVDKCLGTSYGQLGVVSNGGSVERLWPIAALTSSSVDSFDMALAMLRGIGRLASGDANKGEIGGPVKIAEISGRAASQGLANFIVFIAIISINLGLVNLLPLPPLDGGHLLFFALQAVTGRPINVKVQNIVMRLGMAFLLTMIMVVTFFDISGLFLSEC